LDVFSSNASTNEESVAEVNINSDNDGESQVEVSYEHPGKFLGFIPFTVKSTAVVKTKANGETEVKTRKPWYSFLITSENKARVDIESRIKNNSTVKSNAKVNASAEARAKVAEAVVAEVAASAKARSEASINY
jgi:hypothetical protein